MSPRMELILASLRGDRPLFDLCCDHGQLGLAALERWHLPHVSFVDQSPSVMQRLAATIEQSGLDLSKVTLVTGAAETLSVPPGASDFILAGVGGQTIVKILDGLFPSGLGEHRLIISSQQKTQDLRFYLRTRDFRLIDEQVILEKGRFREVLTLGSEGDLVTLYGEKYQQRSDPVSQAFVLHLHYYYLKIQEAKEQGASLSP